jgi:hypothetical protein
LQEVRNPHNIDKAYTHLSPITIAPPAYKLSLESPGRLGYPGIAFVTRRIFRHPNSLPGVSVYSCLKSTVYGGQGSLKILQPSTSPQSPPCTIQLSFPIDQRSLHIGSSPFQVILCHLTIAVGTFASVDPHDYQAHSTVRTGTMATNFTCFSKLPKETQFTVWELASASPSQRVITVRLDASKTQLKVSQSVPAILHASHDSRATALKRYTLLYQGREELNAFYFAFNTDFIFAESPGALRLLMVTPYESEDGKSNFIPDKLQRLMMGGEVGNRGSPECKLVQEFGKLRELKVQSQRGALELGPAADMGATWHKRLAKGFTKDNKGLIVKWFTWAELYKEAAEKFN